VKHGVALWIAILVWWFWGYGFAMGEAHLSAIQWVGTDNAFDIVYWYYLLTLCILAVSIPIGTVTDRMKVWIFGFLSIATAGATFPLLVNWAIAPHVEEFNGSGWLAKRGAIDWVGAGYIHLAAGTTSFVASWFLGPREGRFVTKDGKNVVVEVAQYNAMYATAGTWIVIFGWMNYVLALGGLFAPTDAIRAVVMTAIAMAASAFVASSIVCIKHQRAYFSLQLLNNALLGGLVGITAGAANCDAVGAFFIGVGSGIVAVYGPTLCVWLKVDDPRDVVTVHGLQAIWGIFAIGLWAKEAYAGRDSGEPIWGAFYSGDGRLLGYQLTYECVVFLVALCITLFTMGFCWFTSKFILSHKGDSFLTVSSADRDTEVSNDFPFLFEYNTSTSAAKNSDYDAVAMATPVQSEIDPAMAKAAM